MKLSHDIHDFQEVVSKGFYYIDRTPYIEKLERSQDRLVLFRRPHGFDRKLFISMLSYYYGIQYHRRFEELFNRFYIGRHKTARANRYHILTINLCNLNPAGLQQTEQTLLDAVKQGVELFLRQYPAAFVGDQADILHSVLFEEILTAFLGICRGLSLYLFLDDEQGLISDIADPGKHSVSFSPIARSVISRFFQLLMKGLTNGAISRILALGIDDSADR